MKPLEEMGKFATVVVDPPWPLQMAATYIRPLSASNSLSKTELDYRCMSLDVIGQLPIQAILEDDARVFCWAVNRLLPDAIECMRQWGLSYEMTFGWVKTCGMQPPGMPCSNLEFVIVGKVGHPAFVDTRAFKAGNCWDRGVPKNGSHSHKPEGFYDLLRRVTPGPRLDVFGRRRIAGFTSWGNEAPEGEPLPDHYQQVLMS